ncbi:MAG: hypothetical protein V7633_1345, partial [Pseudonocardia sp.]
MRSGLDGRLSTDDRAALDTLVGARGNERDQRRCFGWWEGVARGGVEPPTFRFSGGRSYQLSYLARRTGMTPEPGEWSDP